MDEAVAEALAAQAAAGRELADGGVGLSFGDGGDDVGAVEDSALHLPEMREVSIVVVGAALGLGFGHDPAVEIAPDRLLGFDPHRPRRRVGVDADDRLRIELVGELLDVGEIVEDLAGEREILQVVALQAADRLDAFGIGVGQSAAEEPDLVAVVEERPGEVPGSQVRGVLTLERLDGEGRGSKDEDTGHGDAAGRWWNPPRTLTYFAPSTAGEAERSRIQCVSAGSRFFCRRRLRRAKVAIEASGSNLRPGARRWPQTGIDLPWYDRPDALEILAARAAAGRYDERQYEWLEKWVVDGYVVVSDLVDARRIDGHAERSRRHVDRGGAGGGLPDRGDSARTGRSSGRDARGSAAAGPGRENRSARQLDLAHSRVSPLLGERPRHLREPGDSGPVLADLRCSRRASVHDQLHVREPAGATSGHDGFSRPPTELPGRSLAGL